jgi:hypothetical protein
MSKWRRKAGDLIFFPAAIKSSPIFPPLEIGCFLHQLLTSCYLLLLWFALEKPLISKVIQALCDCLTQSADATVCS